MRTKTSERGLTLIEACAVVAVTAILAATAAPGMQRLIDNRRLDGAATQLATDIQYLRTEAVARNLPLRLSLHATADGSCYVLHSGAAADCVCGASGPAQCGGEAVEIKTVMLPTANRVSLQSRTASLLFDPLHGTVSPTATLRLTGAQGQPVQHVVNMMGRVRTCSPDALAGYRAC